MEVLQKYRADELKNIIEKYPYFTLAKLALENKEKTNDSLLDLLRRVGVLAHLQTLCKEKQIAPTSTTDLIIDSFLSKTELRIKPSNDASDEDLSLGENPLDDDEIISEELAEILLLQGLNQQAKQMYLKLSLLYPKKSVYFAKIISKIEE